jgi:hypothetical protein
MIKLSVHDSRRVITAVLRVATARVLISIQYINVLHIDKDGGIST